jgi:hypothetical protein
MKTTVISHMSKNVDKNDVFEFLKAASLDDSEVNFGAQKEAYWIIVYIFIMKTQSIDISQTFDTPGGRKIYQMLPSIELADYEFTSGFLNHKGSKVS